MLHYHSLKLVGLQVLPTSESFDASVYLAVIHAVSCSAQDLGARMCIAEALRHSFAPDLLPLYSNLCSMPASSSQLS